MKKIRLIALLICAAMIVTMFAACADNGDNGIGTRPSGNNGGTSEGPGDSSFVSADYNSDDFTILTIQQTTSSGRDYYGGAYIDAEGYNGGTINDAVHERNMKVEEKYNVTINERIEQSGEPASVLQTFYMSGDFCFDAIYGWGYKLGACITENYFANIKDLPNVDLTQDYWSPSAMEDLTINNKLYTTINDISMNKLEWADILYFNKSMVENYNLESTYGSFYDLVRNGKWTLDTYLSLVSSISTDVDGNGVITNSDYYGLIDGDSTGSNLAHSSGISYSTKQDDGSYVLGFYNDKLLSLTSKVYNTYSNSKYVRSYDDIWSEGGDQTGYNDQWEYARSFFSTGHALFCTGSLNTTGEYKNMEDSYGVLPYPKYDENQENYNTYVSSLSSMFAIPMTTRNDVSTASSERTGTILEFMAYKSNEILLPAYYDTLIKGQRVEQDDAEMLDIIRKNIRYEFTDVCGLTDIAEVVNTIFKKPTSASSTYTRNQTKLTKELNDFYTKVLLLDTKNAES